MKKFLALLLCALFLILSVLQSYAAAQPTALTESDIKASAEDMMESITGFKYEASESFFESASYLTAESAEKVKEYTDVFGALIEQLCSRMDYKIQAAKQENKKAIVDISVTAVNAEKVIAKVIEDAAIYSTIQKLLNREPDLSKWLAGHVPQIMDNQNTLTSNTSVYLVMGGDENWKIDISNGKNFDFLVALCGGGIGQYSDILKELLTSIKE